MDDVNQQTQNKDLWSLVCQGHCVHQLFDPIFTDIYHPQGFQFRDASCVLFSPHPTPRSLQVHMHVCVHSEEARGHPQEPFIRFCLLPKSILTLFQQTISLG